MNKDRKEVFSEAYYDAIEDGKSEAEAEKIASEKLTDHEASMIDEAMEILKYIEIGN